MIALGLRNPFRVLSLVLDEPLEELPLAALGEYLWQLWQCIEAELPEFYVDLEREREALGWGQTWESRIEQRQAADALGKLRGPGVGNPGSDIMADEVNRLRHEGADCIFKLPADAAGVVA
jgi:hypothetical protein